MRIYNGQDIEKEFSEIVSQYMQDGFRLHPTTMGGSQGEIAKVDVTDGSYVVRIRIDHGTDHDVWADYVTIIEERFTAEEGRGDILWDGKGTMVAEHRFYQLGERGCAWRLQGKFTTKAAYEAAKIHDKRKARIMNEYDEDAKHQLDSYDKELVLKIVRSVKGLGTCRADEITKVWNASSHDCPMYQIFITGHRLQCVFVTRFKTEAR